MSFITSILIVLAFVYLCIYVAVWKFNFMSNYIGRIGPFLTIQTSKVEFFDRFKRFSKFFEVYGILGVLMVVIIGAFVFFILIIGVINVYNTHPEPTGVFAPNNIFIIPGLNDFVPLTAAVFIGMVIAMAVHECGHAILCRVKNIKLKSTGIIFAILPIGAFVDPNNEDVENASIKSRLMMFGAGITNNIVIGIITLFIMFLLVSTFVTSNSAGVMVYSVYKDTPAGLSGISPGETIYSINGINVNTDLQFLDIINHSRPGDRMNIVVGSGSYQRDINIVLAERPDYARSGMNAQSGYIGLSTYDLGSGLKEFTRTSFNPVGIAYILYSPIGNDPVSGMLKQLAYDTTYSDRYTVDIPGFWSIIHILFWISWMNINIGIFNALPAVPLDGGYIFKDIVRKILGNTKYVSHASKIASGFSIITICMIVMMYAIPHVYAFMR